MKPYLMVLVIGLGVGYFFGAKINPPTPVNVSKEAEVRDTSALDREVLEYLYKRDRDQIELLKFALPKTKDAEVTALMGKKIAELSENLSRIKTNYQNWFLVKFPADLVDVMATSTEAVVPSDGVIEMQKLDKKTFDHDLLSLVSANEMKDMLFLRLAGENSGHVEARQYFKTLVEKTEGGKEEIGIILKRLDK